MAEAKPAYEEALSIFRLQYGPHNFQHSAIANCIRDLKRVLKSLGDESGLEALGKVEEDGATRSDDPENHVRLAGLLLTNKPTGAQKEEARRLIQWAIEEDVQVAVDFPDNLEHRRKAAAGFVQLLKICIAAPGFAGEVDELNRRLAAELPQLLAAFPDSGDCQSQTANIYSHWANGLLPYSNYLPTAEHAYRKSVEIAERLSHSEPNRPGVWLYLANTYCWLGQVQWRSAKPEDAEAAYRRAMEIYDQHAAEIATEPTPYTKINDYLCFANYLVATHKEVEAAEFVRKAEVDAKRLTDPVELDIDLFGLSASATATGRRSRLSTDLQGAGRRTRRRHRGQKMAADLDLVPRPRCAGRSSSAGEACRGICRKPLARPAPF